MTQPQHKSGLFMTKQIKRTAFDSVANATQPQKAPDYWNKLKLYTFDKVNALLKDERAKMFLALDGFDYGDYIIELDNGKVFDEKNFLMDIKKKLEGKHD